MNFAPKDKIWSTSFNYVLWLIQWSNCRKRYWKRGLMYGDWACGPDSMTIWWFLFFVCLHVTQHVHTCNRDRSVNNKEIKFIMILWDTTNSITSYAKYICYLNSTTFGYLVLFVEPYLLCEEIWNLKYTSQRQCEYIFLQVGCSAFKCLTIVFFDSHFLMDLVTKL